MLFLARATCRLPISRITSYTVSSKLCRLKNYQEDLQRQLQNSKTDSQASVLPVIAPESGINSL